MLSKAARALAALDERVVFTGGATISLYLDEVAAADVRPTNDVDCVVEVTSTAKYYQLSAKLREIGLQEYTGGPLCRWYYEDLIIDIMPTDPSVLGFSNSWYIPGIAKSITYDLPSGQQIWIFSVPYLFASKIEAFRSRGERDFYGSSDFEDIVTLLDGCPFLEEEVQHADADVKAFVKEWFRTELETLHDYAPVHLSYVARNAGREQLLLTLIEKLAK